MDELCRLLEQLNANESELVITNKVTDVNSNFTLQNSDPKALIDLKHLTHIRLSFDQLWRVFGTPYANCGNYGGNSYKNSVYTFSYTFRHHPHPQSQQNQTECNFNDFFVVYTYSTLDNLHTEMDWNIAATPSLSQTDTFVTQQFLEYLFDKMT